MIITQSSCTQVARPRVCDLGASDGKFPGLHGWEDLKMISDSVLVGCRLSARARGSWGCENMETLQNKLVMLDHEMWKFGILFGLMVLGGSGIPEGSSKTVCMRTV